MNDRIMRRPEVLATVGVSESTLYLMIRKRQFPRGFNIGDRCVGWSRQRIQEWVQSKAQGVGQSDRLAG